MEFEIKFSLKNRIFQKNWIWNQISIKKWKLKVNLKSNFSQKIELFTDSSILYGVSIFITAPKIQHYKRNNLPTSPRTILSIPSENVKCGSTVRLLHLSTRRNLHSHLFTSPLSNNQEVSAFGENGDGDEGDLWTVDCDLDESWSRQV